MADSPRRCSAAKAESLEAGAGLLLEQPTPANTTSSTESFPALPLTLGLPAARIRQLSGNAPIELSVGRFVFLLEHQGCPLQRVENVAEVKLRHRRDGFAVVSH